MKYDLSNHAAIAAAATEAGTRAGMEPSQGSYNAAWLHGYARALYDVSRGLDDPGEFFAVVRWCIEDIQELRPDWTGDECRQWWKENEKAFHDLLTQYGNEILSDMLP